MEKHMEEVSVKTTDEGKILIHQDDPGIQEGSTVILTPDQVDLIVQWLQEAKAELQKKST